MISAILYDTDNTERESLLESIRDIIALCSSDESRIMRCGNLEELEYALSVCEINDFCCTEFSDTDGEGVANAIRRKYPDTELMLLVNNDVSPGKYIRPGIKPSSVLIRPYSESEMKETISDFISSAIGKVDTKDFFVIENRDGILKIPYDSIAYIEANSKRVFVRIQKEEYGLYDTLDSIQDNLPDYFVRCHRSYIVNLKMIIEYVATQNVLRLSNGLIVPVSRSYKNRIKEIIS